MSPASGIRRSLQALLALGIVALAASAATYAAFSRTTVDQGNVYRAGTVSIEDNDSGAALLQLVSAGPGTTDTSCVKVTYTGSLSAGVRLYATVSGGLPPYLTLTVTRGSDSSPSFDSCAAFSSDATNYIGAGAGVVYSGPLSGFPTSWAAGLVDPTPGSPESWTTSEAHSYRFAITLGGDLAGQGRSGSAGFTWEARNE